MKRSELKKKVLDIVNTPPPEDLGMAFMDAPEAFNAAMVRGNSGKVGYQIPGFDRLSYTTGGLRQNGFSILSGPSGAGKTTLLANLWLAFQKLNLPVFTAPVENGKEDFVDMIVSIESGKSRLSLGRVEWAHVAETVKPRLFANRMNVFSNHESRVSHIDLLTDIYYAHQTKGIKIALCDNWQFMLDMKAGKDQNFESDKALHECVVFTKHVPVHIFMVMHPRKTENERVDSMYEIKGSSTSVQEAHNIWLFNKLKNASDAPPFVNSEFCREILVAKARYNGRCTGSKIIYQLDAVSELYREYKEK